jgi:phage antirepressor YoqD-like protein
MANATSMCNHFNKRPNDWLRLDSTKRYLNALSERNTVTGFPVTVIQGGEATSQGTWIHQRLILNLARWLDVDFEIWCDERIAELLNKGQVSIKPKSRSEILKEAYAILEEDLSKERSLREKAENAVVQLKPHAEYAMEVLESDSTYNTTQIAKELGMSAIRMNKFLKERGVQYKTNGQWVLTAKYQDKGYTDTRTKTQVNSKGEIKTFTDTIWTEEGRRFIHRFIF